MGKHTAQLNSSASECTPRADESKPPSSKISLKATRNHLVCVHRSAVGADLALGLDSYSSHCAHSLSKLLLESFIIQQRCHRGLRAGIVK